MKRGYIKLWRKIWSNKLFQEKRKFSRFEAWVDMVMLANGKEKEIIFDGKPLLIKRGQFLTSQRQLAVRWRWSKTKTREFLYSLQNHDHSIKVYSDRKKSIITILNYEHYNPLTDEEKTTENEEKKTTERPLKDHRLVPTNKSISNVNFNFSTEQWETLTDKDKKRWKKTYPACDVEQELLKMADWLVAHPNRRKKNYRAFISRWLANRQKEVETKIRTAKPDAAELTRREMKNQ